MIRRIAYRAVVATITTGVFAFWVTALSLLQKSFWP